MALAKILRAIALAAHVHITTQVSRADRLERKDASRTRPAATCGSRGRTMVAFGAHTDEPFVQDELERITYTTLRHPDPDGVTVRVPLQKLLKNGTTAFRVFVSHQLLMAALPTYVLEDKVYDYAWVVEEDAKMVGGAWADLFKTFNASSADLVAYARQTNRGRAALLPTARLSTRLLRGVAKELDRIAAGAKGSRKKTIHGAFTYQMCAGAKWCSHAAIPDEWFGPYRAKCAWSGARFDDLAPRWRNPTGHGKVFHPVKLRAPTSGRDFRHFRCKELFAKEARAHVER
ncbi:hypothetical protein JL722_6833 [Aureococcus anophagefferens]|nr:hypothetical protein JL722_6833 [Aureococcus anophagefferens]